MTLAPGTSLGPHQIPGPSELRPERLAGGPRSPARFENEAKAVDDAARMADPAGRVPPRRPSRSPCLPEAVRRSDRSDPPGGAR